MKKLIFCLVVLGLCFQSYAQVTKTKTEKLSEVVIAATNYKYLNKVGLTNASIPVEMLQNKVANFDLKNSEFYHDEYDFYEISFFIPEGKILAAYDKDGNILRTAERFKDVTLPKDVVNSVAERFPNWKFEKDVYLVRYHDERGVTKKYVITLKNGDKKMRVKCDAKGKFI